MATKFDLIVSITVINKKNGDSGLGSFEYRECQTLKIEIRLI